MIKWIIISTAMYFGSMEGGDYELKEFSQNSTGVKDREFLQIHGAKISYDTKEECEEGLDRLPVYSSNKRIKVPYIPLDGEVINTKVIISKKVKKNDEGSRLSFVTHACAEIKVFLDKYGG